MPWFFRFTLSIMICVLAGCASVSLPDEMVLGPSYHPKNVYRQSTSLPESLRRVAVLPLSVAVDGLTSDAGREALQSSLYLELAKCQAFELAYVTPAQLQHWTGKRDWRAEEKLPATFFAQLREQSGCDAVLFCQLTQYRPYRPLAIGWQFKLVDAQAPRIWWSADEVFDGGESSVRNAARRYGLDHFKERGGLNDSQFILSSPKRFGEYSLSAVLTSLPTR